MSMIASGYGQALYDLAAQEQAEAQILSELELLNDAFSKDPDYLRLLATPEVSKQERCTIVDNSFAGKVHPYVLNFLKLLTEEGYARSFPSCCAVYRDLYNEANGIVRVLAVTAVSLTEDQSQRLTQKLEKVTGKKIQLQNKVDPACMGGVRLDFDGKRMDGTVYGKLQDIAALLKNTVL